MNHKLAAYRLKYKYGRYLKLKSPVDVTLELASVCNQKCAYCYHADKSTPFEKGYMSLKTAYAILIQAKEIGARSVKLNWRGESLLNPNFYQIAHFAYTLGFYDRISNTNFNFPTNREDIFKGFALQTKVKISLDSFDRAVMDAQRKGSNHDHIIANIDKFYAMPRKNAEIVIQMVRTILNKDEKLKESIESRWPGVSYSIRDCVANRSDNSENLACEEMTQERVPCYQAFARLIFDINGNATCCCPDIKNEIRLGNIENNTLKAIWKNTKHIKKMLKSGEAFSYEPCKSCSSLESYKGYKFNWSS